MYTISTYLILPISHCLYRGAYSGLCCGNVYRDLKDDGEKDRYDLSTCVFPVIHGHTYRITVSITTDDLDKNGMVVDFKKMKKTLNEYFEKYDHSMILTPDNPLVDVYLKTNTQENNKKLILWDENPTAEYMAACWHEILLAKFKDLNIHKLSVTVEETAHNSVTAENN